MLFAFLTLLSWSLLLTLNQNTTEKQITKSLKMANANLTIIPKVAKLSPRVISILGCNPGPMTLRGTNTYIIGKGKRYKRQKMRHFHFFKSIFRRILLDTADGQVPEYFLNLKKSLNFDKISIKDIILSHWHPDHVGGTKEVLKSAEVTLHGT